MKIQKKLAFALLGSFVIFNPSAFAVEVECPTVSAIQQVGLNIAAVNPDNHKEWLASYNPDQLYDTPYYWNFIIGTDENGAEAAENDDDALQKARAALPSLGAPHGGRRNNDAFAWCMYPVHAGMVAFAVGQVGPWHLHDGAKLAKALLRAYSGK